MDLLVGEENPISRPELFIDNGITDEQVTPTSIDTVDASSIQSPIPDVSVIANMRVVNPLRRRQPKSLAANRSKMYDAVSAHFQNLSKPPVVNAADMEYKCMDMELKKQTVDLDTMKFLENKTPQDIQSLKAKLKMFNAPEVVAVVEKDAVLVEKDVFEKIESNHEHQK